MVLLHGEGAALLSGIVGVQGRAVQLTAERR
eukprot:COSAG02_NODE_397_length_23124_cov_439.255635_7_plen_31_part_00